MLYREQGHCAANASVCNIFKREIHLNNTCRYSSCLTESILPLNYKGQSVNVIAGHNHSIFWDAYGRVTTLCGKMRLYLMLRHVGEIVTVLLWSFNTVLWIFNMHSSRSYSSSFDRRQLHTAETNVQITEVHVEFVMKWHWVMVFSLYFTLCQLSFHQHCISFTFVYHRRYVFWLLRSLLHKVNKQSMFIQCLQMLQ